MLSGSFQRQLGEVSDPTQSLGSAHRPLLPGLPPGGGGSNNSSNNRVRGAGAGSAMARQTDGRTDGPCTRPRCRGNLNYSSGSSLLAPPRPVPGTPAPEEEVGGREEEEVGGKGNGHPSQCGRCSPAPRRRKLETGFPRIGTPKLLSAHGILLLGEPSPFAADLRGWDRISVATLSQHLSASCVQLYTRPNFAFREAAIFSLVGASQIHNSPEDLEK